MVTNEDPGLSWGSRRIYLLVLTCQIMSTSMFVELANTAVAVGPTGYILSYIVCSLLAGIPLLYMEFIIGQFTARDSIGVWKARPCVSHIGYIIVFWQVINVLYNHIVNSFIFHYFLVTFENPIPYYTCGYWSTSSCNILISNFTVNEDCIRHKQNQPAYCANLHATFPEYQYWRYRIMGTKSNERHLIAWRVCLASGLICFVTYLSLFRRKSSVKYAIYIFTLFPLIGYILLLLGSMLQKGIVVKYHDALDSDFKEFENNFSLSGLIMQMTYNFGVGSGVTFNVVRTSAFRTPCYSDTVITVVVFVAASALAVCTSAMMACPYAYEYGIDPYMILKTSMTLLFEKTPRFLFEYQNRLFYVILVYSCHTALGVGTNMILILHLVEMAVMRNPKVARYPGLTSFVGIILLFLITMPLMCSTGVSTMFALRRISCLLFAFVAILEIGVFIIWYGMDKFCEDVHFMQGIPPTNYMKICWVLSIIFLSYTFIVESWEMKKANKRMSDVVSWYVNMACVGLILIIFILKVLIAACRKKLNEEFRLDPSWGPKNEVLQRSRAMFTAQAMTKEYLYRQYHLQAGILARQNTSNCRTARREL